jgi:hypothetical protein
MSDKDSPEEFFDEVEVRNSLNLSPTVHNGMPMNMAKTP